MARFSYSVGPDTGASKVDRYTSGNANHSLSFTGTGDKNDSIVVSWLDPASHAVKTSTTKVGSNGSWSITTPQLSDGAYAFTIKETGTQTASATVPAWTLDTKTNVSILGPALDTGRSGSDGITKGGIAHTVLGTAEAGDTVLLTYVDAKGSRGALGTVTADASGKWSIKTPVAPDGAYTVTALAMDKAGNTATSSFKAILDSVAPTAPTLTVKDDGGAVVTSTTDGTLHVSGAAEANSSVAVSWKDAAGHAGTLAPVLAANGTWSVDTGTLGVGTYTFTAAATDVAGNVSKASAAFGFKIVVPANAAPLGSDKIVDAQEDSGNVSVDLNKMFTDPDGDKLTFKVVPTVNGPSLDYNSNIGVISIDTNSAFFDSLNTGQTEKYVYNISADDGKGRATTKTLAFNIAGHTDAPPNRAPVLKAGVSEDQRVYEDTGVVRFNFHDYYIDPDGDVINFTKAGNYSLPAGITFDPDTATITVDTDRSDSFWNSANTGAQGGTFVVAVNMDDGHGNSPLGSLSLTFEGHTDAPPPQSTMRLSSTSPTPRLSGPKATALSAAMLRTPLRILMATC